MCSDTPSTTGSSEDALALRKELGIRRDQGGVGIGDGEWLVIIFDKVKKPPIIKWKGWPVRYHIGGGMPRAALIGGGMPRAALMG